MNKSILVITAGIAIGLAAGWFFFHSPRPSAAAGERRILYYRDPMNPRDTSATPRKAPDGMDYVPVYADEPAAAAGRTIAYYKDPMHPWYTSDKPGKAPDCGMDLVPVYEGESGAQGIRIDPAMIQNIGVKIEKVEQEKLNRVIRTTGKIDIDERRVYAVNTKVMGWVEKLYVDFTGQRVRKGEPLMELYSPELVTTQEEYLQAVAYGRTLSGSSVEEARKESAELLQSAKRRLLYWDIPESEIQALELRGKPKKTMTIYSPANGIVTEKMVNAGQNVMAGMELYKVVDLSSVWVLADIYPYELPWVKVGDQAEIRLSYIPGKSFRGTITYISPYLSDETKTAKVRIAVANTPGLELKPDMYATVTVVSPLSINAVVVPSQAIIRSGERNIAVVALGGGYFEPREVKLGVESEGKVQVLNGLSEGDGIVVSSQFLIDSESNLKAAISQMSTQPKTDTAASSPKPEHTHPQKHQSHGAGHEGTDGAHAQGTADAGGGAHANAGQLYTCIMHPEVVSEQPGTCPGCGMTLVPKKTS